MQPPRPPLPHLHLLWLAAASYVVPSVLRRIYRLLLYCCCVAAPSGKRFSPRGLLRVRAGSETISHLLLTRDSLGRDCCPGGHPGQRKRASNKRRNGCFAPLSPSALLLLFKWYTLTPAIPSHQQAYQKQVEMEGRRTPTV